MEKWLSLKIEVEVSQVVFALGNGFFEKLFGEHSRRPGEAAQTTGTLRASQVATCGRFNRECGRISPMNGFSDDLAEVEGKIQEGKVVEFLQTQVSQPSDSRVPFIFHKMK
jgi:hypothetical protein